MERSAKRPCHEWDTIPAPVLFQLLVKLPLLDARALALAHKAAAVVWRLERLWEDRLKRDFGQESLNDETALDAYKDEHKLTCSLAEGDRILLYGAMYLIDLSDIEFLNKLIVQRNEYFYTWCALRRKYDVCRPSSYPLLMVATQKNQLNAVKRLVHHGADVYESDVELTPILIALENEYVQVFTFLLEKMDLDEYHLMLLCKRYRTWALHEAFRQNKIVDDAYMLHYACECGELASVQLLLDHGADLTQTDHRGKTPIELARQMCQMHVVEYLEYRRFIG